MVVYATHTSRITCLVSEVDFFVVKAFQDVRPSTRNEKEKLVCRRLDDLLRKSNNGSRAATT